MRCLVGLPRKKKRRLQNKQLMLYQTVDLFRLVLDHIPLVGIDVAKLIHQQLYHDILVPLLSSLPSLVIMIGCFLDNPIVHTFVVIATMSGAV